jgi:hypothetical protein
MYASVRIQLATLIVIWNGCAAASGAKPGVAVSIGGIVAGQKSLARNCPWPNGGHFAATNEALKQPRYDRVMGETGPAVSGCAVIKFTLTKSGVVDQAGIVTAHPAGVGIHALNILRATYFNPGPLGATYMIRLGLERPENGTWSVFPNLR